LSPSELSHDDWNLADGIRTVVNDVASFRLRHAESVEAVAVKLCFDDITVAGILILRHRVHVKLVEDLVGPRVLREIEDDRITTVSVTNSVALVARSDVEVESRSYSGQILVELHARPRNEDVGVDFVDRVSRCSVVADEVDPVVAKSGVVERTAELVVKGHRDNVGVALGPVRHVTKTSDPVLGIELDIAEP
jgi:hypothetical protein